MDAVAAYRRIKLCRAKGIAWCRNGERVQVGHFQVDSINKDGSFRAACHRFNWQEIHRLASELGVA